MSAMARNLMREVVLRTSPLLFPLRSGTGTVTTLPVRILGDQLKRNLIICRRNFSSTSAVWSRKLSEDRIEMYVDEEVQSLLRTLTGKEYSRVFRKRKTGQKLKEPKYTFMTEEQLVEALKEADEKAQKSLQMPPVLRPRKDIYKELSFDPELQGVEKSTIIFTDITMNINDRDRLIVARDPDGTLRYASWAEREKMNQIYFPREGKEFMTPKMFEDSELLNQILGRASDEDNTYEFVLDRACLQFEPDDPLYVGVCETVYNTIDERRHFDYLKSTRHYGPFVFYLARTRRMDNLLFHSLTHDRITDDALPLVSLFHVLFPESKSKMVSKGAKNDLEVIRAYVELDAVKRSDLELALNAHEERTRSRENLTSELEKSHGIEMAR